MAAGRVTAKTKIFEIKIELRDVRPAVLRRVQVPGEMSLAELHAVVQVVMGWTDSHLHEFDVDGARYGRPDPDWAADEVGDESGVTLFRIIGQGGRMDYVYDFGDGWSHRLTVEKVLAPEQGVSYPRCVSGRRACLPEDVGGEPGVRRILAAMNHSPAPRACRASGVDGWPVRPGRVRPRRGERGAGRVGLAPAARIGRAHGSSGVGRTVDHLTNDDCRPVRRVRVGGPNRCARQQRAACPQSPCCDQMRQRSSSRSFFEVHPSACGAPRKA